MYSRLGRLLGALFLEVQSQWIWDPGGSGGVAHTPGHPPHSHFLPKTKCLLILQVMYVQDYTVGFWSFILGTFFVFNDEKKAYF